jgi:hypothetical protein
MRLLTPQLVVSTFPATFGLFLDSIGDSAEDRSALVDVCEQLGVDRLLDARTTLVGAGGLLTAERRRRLLATDSPAVLPFAALALETCDAEAFADVVGFLTRLKLEHPESSALRIIEDPALQPRDYVVAL